ncbi:putative zinc metalloprotease EGY2 chloroplastic [Bienertia sinuspersici]
MAHDQQEGQNTAPPLQINESSTNLTGEGNGYNRRRDVGNDDAVASFGVRINDANIGGEVARCLHHARDPVSPTETLVLQAHVTHNNADHESVTNSKENVERKIRRVNILKEEALPQHMGGGKNDEGSVRAGDKRKLTDAMDIDVNEDNISAQREEKKGVCISSSGNSSGMGF